jgi:muramoyltetrapeptide carboxypeptidase
MPAEKAATALQILELWGYRIRKGATFGHQFNYFSGTDEQRRNDLQEMLDDPEVKAILCARGGYGLTRIIDDLDFTSFAANPKWIIGYSDITVLHSHIYSRYGISSLHAPMASAFNDGGAETPYVQSLRDALSGVSASYACEAHSFNRRGVATGPLLGGNLSLLAHLCGTPSAMNTTGAILFIEDIGEYIYNIDRMLYQLKRSGFLEHLNGVIVGGFTEMKDTAIPFGSSIEEVIRNVFSTYQYPVCFNFPVSHTERNYALKIGVDYTLSVSETGVLLLEQ